MTQAATLAQLASSGALSADTSGNVGIGASNSGAYGKLGVLGSGYQAAYVQSNDASGVISVLASNSSAETRVGSISNHPLYFMVNGDSKARIDTGGNLLVGTASQIQSATFSVLSTTSTAGFRTTATAGSGIVLEVSRTSATGDMVYFRTSSTTLAGFITCPTGTTTSYASVSDYRLKENVQPMVGALDKVAQLKPCTYTWKSDGSDGQGFIAHELQAVVPDCVTGEKDAVNEDGSIKPQGVDTSFLVATLTAAIQELKAELDVCKAEIAALKGV
jgi:hypothetical protein